MTLRRRQKYEIRLEEAERDDWLTVIWKNTKNTNMKAQPYFSKSDGSQISRYFFSHESELVLAHMNFHLPSALLKSVL